MEMVIQRFARYKKSVHGLLRIDGETVCHTLENADNCLPPGRYCMEMKHLEGFRRRQAVVSGQASLVARNGAYGLENGQISIGECRHLGYLIRCACYLEPLLERIRMALRRGRKISVVILGDDGARNSPSPLPSR